MEIYFAVLLWAICAVACFYIGRSKHAAHPENWAYVGVFFGPFAVLLAILAKDEGAA